MKASKVPTIKQLLEKGQYRIEPHTIADAIIRWVRARPAAVVDSADLQNECSKPESSSPASLNVMPVGPSSTDPIQVTPAFARGEL